MAVIMYAESRALGFQNLTNEILQQMWARPVNCESTTMNISSKCIKAAASDSSDRLKPTCFRSILFLNLHSLYHVCLNGKSCYITLCRVFDILFISFLPYPDDKTMTKLVLGTRQRHCANGTGHAHYTGIVP